MWKTRLKSTVTGLDTKIDMAIAEVGELKALLAKALRAQGAYLA